MEEKKRVSVLKDTLKDPKIVPICLGVQINYVFQSLKCTYISTQHFHPYRNVKIAYTKVECVKNYQCSIL